MKMKKVLTTIICLIISISSAMAQHKLGDIIELNGVKGMVIQVDDAGEHGLAMSIARCGEPWLADKDAKFETSAFYEDDGRKI